MVKYMFLLLNVAALSFYNLFVDEVSVTPSAPTIASAGADVIVELTIDKGSVSGFAKLQQDLPEGFTATALETMGASFTFSSQSVKFIWTQLPAESQFKVTYKITVDKEASGTKEFEGKFSYVVDNAKLSVAIPVTSIVISDADESEEVTAQKKEEEEDLQSNATSGSSTETNSEQETSEPADDNATEENQEQETEPIVPIEAEQPSVPLPTETIICTRKMPAEASSSFDVEVTIQKGKLSGFAKLQENLPEGFTATSLETSNSSFTFADQQVKFVWISLPGESEFKVSYRVNVAKSLIAQKNIDGVFSYLENDETKKYVVENSSIFINNASEGIVSEATSDTPPPTEKKSETSDKVEEAAKSVSPSVPSAQNGINYKVQICAIRKNIPSTYFTKTYNIQESIDMENHEGWVKYTVGGFQEYKQARDHREIIREKKVKGPFVTAYNNGKRITVQEALMITGQQWYK